MSGQLRWIAIEIGCPLLFNGMYWAFPVHAFDSEIPDKHLPFPNSILKVK